MNFSSHRDKSVLYSSQTNLVLNRRTWDGNEKIWKTWMTWTVLELRTSVWCARYSLRFDWAVSRQQGHFGLGYGIIRVRMSLCYDCRNDGLNYVVCGAFYEAWKERRALHPSPCWKQSNASTTAHTQRNWQPQVCCNSHENRIFDTSPQTSRKNVKNLGCTFSFAALWNYGANYNL